jgi:predicted small secreted protein
MHVFYHADRYNLLAEKQNISLNEQKLSRFGAVYWSKIEQGDLTTMNSDEKREYYLEQIKRENRYRRYSSRLQSIFAANSIWEAEIFAREIIPKPDNPINIVEIYSDQFWNLDMTWLDFVPQNHETMMEYYRHYWEGKISNSCPTEGDRKPPRIEVMISLPAITGKIIKTVTL